MNRRVLSSQHLSPAGENAGLGPLIAAEEMFVGMAGTSSVYAQSDYTLEKWEQGLKGQERVRSPPTSELLVSEGCGCCEC